MVAFLYSKFSVWFILVAGLFTMGYLLCVAPKEKLVAQNINLVSVNNQLKEIVTNIEAKLLICSLKRKSETFESEMKGEKNAISENNYTDTNKLIF